MHIHLIQMDTIWESPEKNRDSVESVMTSEQLLEAQNLTRECIKKNYKNCD